MAPEQVIAKVFGVPAVEITAGTSNKSIGAWDSLGHMTLILELEATYGVSLSPEEVFTMVSLDSIKQVLREHGVAC